LIVSDRINIAAVYLGVLSHLFYSFYFHSIGVAPFALLSAVILFYLFICYSKKIFLFDASIKKSFLLLISFEVFSMLWSVFICYFEGFEFYPQSFIGLFLNAGMFLGLVGLSQRGGLKKHGINAFKLFYFISIFLFMIQIAAWYMFQERVDYMFFFTGEEQRLIGHQMDVNGIITRRASGIFAEPAVYCWVMIGIGYFLLDHINAGVLKYCAQGLIYLSIFASFSLSGWLVCCVAELLKAIRDYNLKKFLTLILIVACALLFFFYPFIEIYFDTRVSNLSEDGSYNDKISTFEAVYYYWSNVLFAIFGVGVASRLDTPALGFLTSSLLLMGLLGTLILFNFILQVISKFPGKLIDKLFIFFNIGLVGNHITMTLTWFVFGAMMFLMVSKSELKSEVQSRLSIQKNNGIY
jgi:hypothetical protein